MNEAILLLKRIAEGSTDSWARGLARQAIDALANSGGQDGKPK
jgi:hypothetical protein